MLCTSCHASVWTAIFFVFLTDIYFFNLLLKQEIELIQNHKNLQVFKRSLALWVMSQELENHRDLRPFLLLYNPIPFLLLYNPIPFLLLYNPIPFLLLYNPIPFLLLYNPIPFLLLYNPIHFLLLYNPIPFQNDNNPPEIFLIKQIIYMCMLKMSVFTNFAYLGIFLKIKSKKRPYIIYIEVFRENSSKHTYEFLSFHVSIL
jgi:hypothetical protein